MDWLGSNLESVLSVVSIILVVAVWLYLRYRGQLDKLLADGLDYMQKWAGDALENVQESEVHSIADIFYDRYVAETALAKMMTKERLRALF